MVVEQQGCKTGHLVQQFSLSIAPFNTRMVSRETDLLTIIEGKSKTKGKILGLCETRCCKELYREWKEGSTVVFGIGEGLRSAGGTGLIMLRELRT